jgi:hypothetical protein
MTAASTCTPVPCISASWISLAPSCSIAIGPRPPSRSCGLWLPTAGISRSPGSASSPGTGSPTSVPRKELPSYSGMPST